MNIVLIRHGRPELENTKLIRVKDYSRWVDMYNQAGVCSTSTPPIETQNAVRNGQAVYTSDLKRSIHSATILGLGKLEASSSIFRECDIPKTESSTMIMPVSVLTVFYRLLWLLGSDKNCESKVDAIVRAKEATDILINSAKDRGTTVFVGHGFLNRYIAAHLLNAGWLGPKNPGKGYWSCTSYSLQSS